MSATAPHISHTRSAESPASAIAEARELRSDGDLEGAIRVLYTVVSEHWEQADALVDLASMLAEAGRLTAAERCFRRAMQLEPKDFRLQMNYAAYLSQTGRLEDAERALTDLVTRLGQARDIARHAESWDEARQLHSCLGVVDTNLAATLMEAGRHDEAEQRACEWLQCDDLWERAQEIVDGCVSARGECHFSTAERYHDNQLASVGMAVYLTGLRWWRDADPWAAVATLEQALAYLPVASIARFAELDRLLDQVSRHCRREGMAGRGSGEMEALDARADSLRTRLRLSGGKR